MADAIHDHRMRLSEAHRQRALASTGDPAGGTSSRFWVPLVVFHSKAVAAHYLRVGSLNVTIEHLNQITVTIEHLNQITKERDT